MIENIIEALLIIFSWPTIIYLLAGTVIGLVLGVIPGLGGVIGLALLIPFSFSMGADNAIVFFGSVLGGVAFGGCVSAILLNIPGTPSNIATLLDGYPMTQKGRSGEALGISATASAIGATFGLIVLIALIPVARELILLFGPTEFFWLAVLGLAVIAVAAQGRLSKGLAAGGIGFMLAFIGFSPVGGDTRFTFDIFYLYDGIQLVPALIGLYAYGEIMLLSVKGDVISDKSVKIQGKVRNGIEYVFTHPVKLLRASTTGTAVGLVPGVGGITAGFISYLQASHTSNNPDKFGEGTPEGVIATEAANDAKDGGALLPTVVFGIPGSAVMAVLLGGLMLHGVSPGASLLQEDLSIMFILIFSLLFSNILTSVIGLATANRLVKITRVQIELLAPVILVVCILGTYTLRQSLGDVIIAMIFGVIGYWMVSYNYPRLAIVLPLILVGIAETNFIQALQISGGDYSVFFVRPISFILICAIIVSIVIPFRKDIAFNTNKRYLVLRSNPLEGIKELFDSKKNYRGLSTRLKRRSKIVGKDGILHTIASVDKKLFEYISLIFWISLVSIFLLKTPEYSSESQLFPQIIGVFTLIILFFVLIRVLTGHFERSEESDSITSTKKDVPDDPLIRRKRVITISLWIVSLFLIVYMIGHIMGIFIFLLIYYYRSIDLKHAILYTLIIWGMIVGLSLFLNIPVYNGILFR